MYIRTIFNELYCITILDRCTYRWIGSIYRNAAVQVETKGGGWKLTQKYSWTKLYSSLLTLFKVVIFIPHIKHCLFKIYVYTQTSLKIFFMKYLQVQIYPGNNCNWKCYSTFGIKSQIWQSDHRIEGKLLEILWTQFRPPNSLSCILAP